MDVGLLFLSGFTSAFNCVALQTGLLASTMAGKEGERPSFFITWVFLAAKLLAYTLLGFLLGLFGEAVTISEEVGVMIELVASIYIIIAALNVLKVHPILRYTVIQPPRFFTRLVRNSSKMHNLFAPALLGFLTILIPCGSTVAVETLSISSANPFSGAVTMLTFTLGTTPVFLGYGALASFLGEKLKSKTFVVLEGVVILSLGLYALVKTLGELGIIAI